MALSKYRLIIFWCTTIIFLLLSVIFLIGYLNELKKDPQDAIKLQTYQVTFIVLSGIVSSLIASFVAGKFLLIDAKCGRENINNILSTGFLCFKPDQQSLTDEEWAHYIKNAPKKSEIYLFGTANFEWVRTDACRNAFESIIKRNDGVSLYIYFLNPSSEWAKAREKVDKKNAGGTTVERIEKSVEAYHRLFNNFSEKEKSRIHLRYYDTMPSIGIITNGRHLIIKHYLSSATNDRTPISIFEMPVSGTGWKLREEHDGEYDSYVLKYLKNLREIANNFSEDIPWSTVAR